MKAFRSLRWQIQSWHTMLLVLIVGGMLTAFYVYERQVKVQLLDKELWGPVHAIIPAFKVNGGNGPPSRGQGGPMGGTRQSSEGEWFDEMFPPSHQPKRRGEGSPPAGQRPQGGDREAVGPMGGPNGGRNPEDPNKDRIIEKVVADGYYVAAWIEGLEFYSSVNAPQSISKPMMAQGEPRLNSGALTRWNGGNRELIQPTPQGSIVVGISGDRIEADLETFRNKLLLLGFVIIAVGYAGGWWIARRAMLPVVEMEKTAKQISGGDLSQRIDVENTESELGGLASVLNDSFGKLEQAVTQQVRFTADASHEMRTPLAVILAKSELALMRDRSPEKYQETIQTCYDSATHMHSLIESLLELSRIDSGQFSVDLQQGNLGLLVNDSVELIKPLADQREIKISSEVSEVMSVFDHQKLKQVFINLLSNAIKYNREGGGIEVKLNALGKKVFIQVTDTGPGIAANALAHVFDRFYKVDDSRKSEKGSTGLGLAISKAIVEAHQGDISVTSVIGDGTSFTIELPLVDA